MIIWMRNFIIIFIILTIIYMVLTVVSRIKHQHKLSTEYEKEERSISKDQFIDDGMNKYKGSLRSKLLLGVYLVPLVVFGLLKYLAQL